MMPDELQALATLVADARAGATEAGRPTIVHIPTETLAKLLDRLAEVERLAAPYLRNGGRCVTFPRPELRQTSPTIVFLCDGSKVRICRDRTVVGGTWLEVIEQEALSVDGVTEKHHG